MKQQLHTLSFGICTLLIVYLSYSNGVSNVLTWDVFGHYIYLPEIFNNGTIYYKDYSYFEGITKIYDNTPYFYQFVEAENGYLLTKYTSGWAVLMSPFYFLAKIICAFTGYTDDGFSLPYQYCLSFGATFYTIFGLYFLKKIIQRYFSSVTTALVLLFMVLGTNFLFMNYVAKGSSNNLEFTAIAFMLWQTIRFHETFKIKYALGLGIALGLITLIRPPDLLLALVPLGWNVRSYGGVLSKIKCLLQEHRKSIIVLSISFLLLVSIQLVYWYLLTGKLLMNSYANNAGEGFDWFRPYTFSFLFSFRKGWFLYTPLLVFAVFGLVQWAKENRAHGIFPVLTFLLFLYVVSSWTTWWYADSFSQRAMIDIYAFLGIGMACLIERYLQNKNFVLLGIMAVLLVFNLFQTYQIDHGILHTSRMSKEYYFSVFGQVTPPSEAQKELLLIDKGEKLFTGFKDEEKYQICYLKKVSFPENTLISTANQFTPVVDVPIKKISGKDHFWLKTIFHYEGSCESLKGKIFNAATFYKGKSYQYKGRFSDDPLLKVDTVKKTVEFDYLSPDFRSPNDQIRITIYCESGAPLEVEGMEIRGYEKK